MGNLRYVICDVFTDRPLAGNPVAVFTDARGLNAETMQALAREMNLSETVFVTRPERGGHAALRIFTPRREIPFAGHPVLGTAFVLGAPLQLSEIRLETQQAVVNVALQREGPRIVFGWMLQPVAECAPLPDADAAPLLRALGVERSLLPIERYALGPSHVMVALASPAEVAALAPDLSALERIDADICAFAGEGGKFKMRVFAPYYGVPEDPATGSAAGPLALHLVRHDRLAFAQEIAIEQGAEIGRPSTLYARVVGRDREPEGVEVGGQAVVVARGEFRTLTAR